MTDVRTVLVRLKTLSQQAWLEDYAKCENRSLNGAIVDLINRAMADNPLAIVVRCCSFDGEEFYAAAIGSSLEDFYEGPSRVDAIAAAQEKARELGLARTAIRFDTEINEEAMSTVARCDEA
jgi:hypothetical protein